jgi:hypothetical protein
MFAATYLQELENIRTTLRAQDEKAASLRDGPPEDRRAALLAGEYRPACTCSGEGPKPCNDALLGVLTQDAQRVCPAIAAEGKGN